MPHRRLVTAAAPVAALALLAACAEVPDVTLPERHTDATMEELVDQYAVIRLEADLSHLSDGDRAMVRRLIEASEPMDRVFWRQTYGDPEAALALGDGATRRFIEINYGPWDRLRDNEPFVEDVGPKPAGAAFYPEDMTAEELEAAGNPALSSLYTMVRRGPGRELEAVPYHTMFDAEHRYAASKLREAAELSSDAEFANYLRLRADALMTDEYQASDMAWMDMKDNPVDIVIGPIETYDDQLFGYKAAHEAYVLIKDQEWSERLARFAALLPQLQRGLPVDAAYKAETPGTDSDLNAYDAVYYAGQANSGSKTIAINLPNDEQVQLAKGTRRLQLKNAMRAKFDAIMEPIAEELIADDQRDRVTFDAFFENTMFHEVAHGLGIKNTLSGNGTVRESLREHASPMEEGKADVVGLYMVKQLYDMGELTEGSLEDHYVTFLAGIFRSVRFGAASAHGQANMVRFNFFQDMGAFTRDADSETYRVDFEAMGRAVDALSERILTLQGDGDYAGVDTMMREQGVVPAELQADLDRLDERGIPRDIVFEQGVSVLY